MKMTKLINARPNLKKMITKLNPRKRKPS